MRLGHKPPTYSLRFLPLEVPAYMWLGAQTVNGRLKIHALLYARIIVSSILNLATALTACGTFAGSVIVSPDLTR